MNLGRTVFSQLVNFFPTYQFQICVDRYQGNRYVKEFSCWDQFLCLAFAQLTYRESLRDIEACLRAQQPKLYHMGFRGQVSRNTLAHANEHRDWRIYADFAQLLIATARDLYRDEPFGLELSETVYAFDSTTIDLCLTLFPWGKFRRHKSAVKLHTLLDLRGSIPTNVYVTGGQVNDVNILDQLLLEAGSFYLLDRGYLDFARLYIFTQACAFFITRARKDLQFYHRYSRPVERSAGLRCDQTILLTGVRTAKRYPDPLRRIHYFDVEKDLRLTFLTNNFLLSALTTTLRSERRSALKKDLTGPTLLEMSGYGALTELIFGLRAAIPRRPTSALHIQPFTYTLIFLWFGAEPQHVAVEVFHLHLIGPRIVRGNMTDFCPAAPVLLQRCVRVTDADPDPAAGMSLVALAQEEVAFPARHGSKTHLCVLPIEIEPERSHVVIDACDNVRHAQDGSDSLKGSSVGLSFR